MKLKDVEAATMELTLEERAELAGKLILSLDEPAESEVERLWLEEQNAGLRIIVRENRKAFPLRKSFVEPLLNYHEAYFPPRCRGRVDRGREVQRIKSTWRRSGIYS